ncbi:hypothetical protein GE061_013689 [Apolygus lucorum]|uniref:Uncharacterized protein n=1 Tax=Apolygus lucorum TaxID=248454 RepID=A0A8S9XNQ4_APOLU|nr:hypothetical protein GE061_013689 [Apolygus lucorum]
MTAVLWKNWRLQRKNCLKKQTRERESTVDTQSEENRLKKLFWVINTSKHEHKSSIQRQLKVYDVGKSRAIKMSMFSLSPIMCTKHNKNQIDDR